MGVLVTSGVGWQGGSVGRAVWLNGGYGWSSVHRCSGVWLLVGGWRTRHCRSPAVTTRSGGEKGRNVGVGGGLGGDGEVARRRCNDIEGR
jgi:hypothetical protein